MQTEHQKYLQLLMIGQAITHQEDRWLTTRTRQNLPDQVVKSLIDQTFIRPIPCTVATDGQKFWGISNLGREKAGHGKILTLAEAAVMVKVPEVLFTIAWESGRLNGTAVTQEIIVTTDTAVNALLEGRNQPPPSPLFISKQLPKQMGIPMEVIRKAIVERTFIGLLMGGGFFIFEPYQIEFHKAYFIGGKA